MSYSNMQNVVDSFEKILSDLKNIIEDRDIDKSGKSISGVVNELEAEGLSIPNSVVHPESPIPRLRDDYEEAINVLNEAALLLQKTSGTAAVLSILAEFNAKKIRDIDESKFITLHTKLIENM